jgi:hypothetical protein
MRVSKQQAVALVGVGASLFLWIKALQKLWNAAEAADRRPLDLVLATIVAAGAVIIAVRRTEKTVTKLEEAFEPDESAEGASVEPA